MGNLFDLTEKVAVVTGASSGLGADAAVALAEQGADVAILARRTDKLAKVKDRIEMTGQKVIAVACDVSDGQSVKAAIEEVMDTYRKIDILVNNAGVAVHGGVDLIEEKDWDRSFDTNVKGIYHLCGCVVPHMKERQYGKIINIASVNAVIADKSDVFIRHSYNASKAAVVGLTKGMAASYGQYGITVNAVGPGLFESEMTETTLFQSESFLSMYSAQNPMSRPARRGELNGTIVYLASDASSYVTGQLILVDGGITLV